MSTYIYTLRIIFFGPDAVDDNVNATTTYGFTLDNHDDLFEIAYEKLDNYDDEISSKKLYKDKENILKQLDTDFIYAVVYSDNSGMLIMEKVGLNLR